MSNEQTKSRITQIYLSLQERDTNDLVSIWKTNDREKWTDDVFEAIRDILLERTGSLPTQKEKMSDEPQRVTEAITKPQRIQLRKEMIRFMWWDGLSFGLIWVVFELIRKVFPYHLTNFVAPIYIQSTLYALAGSFLKSSSGRQLDLMDRWEGSQPGDITTFDVILDKISERAFRMFENHKFSLKKEKTQPTDARG